MKPSFVGKTVAIAVVLLLAGVSASSAANLLASPNFDDARFELLIPEPTSLVLAGLGALGLLLIRRCAG